MIEIAKGYDSWLDTARCDWCAKDVRPDQPKILCGTGNALASLYHRRCYTLAMAAYEQDPISEARSSNGSL